MTDHDTRPSWLHEPCPVWCTREHHEDDHPEDRRHQDHATSFAAVTGHQDAADMATIATASELVVGRFRLVGQPVTWVSLQEAESRCHLVLSEESASALTTLLGDLL